MYKKKISYLLHSLTSFILMLITVRLLDLLMGDIAGGVIDPYLSSLIVFIISSAAAVLVFYIMPKDITPEDTAEISDPVPPMTKRDIPSCVTFTVIALCFMIGLMYAVSAFLGDGIDSSYTFTPVYFISLVIIHPAVEEFLFRHLYYEELRQLTPVFAVVAQATMFAIDHNTVGAMFNALFCGIVLGALVESTGRWYVAIAAHALMNLRSLLYITVLADFSAVRTAVDIAVCVIGITALAVQIARSGKKKKDIPSDDCDTPDNSDSSIQESDK